MTMFGPLSGYSTKGPVNGVEVNISDVKPWDGSIAKMREVILKLGVGANLVRLDHLPPEARPLALGQDNIEALNDLTNQAVAAGRLIDFGHLPNEVIKHSGVRGMQLYAQGALMHPFSDPWLFRHSMDGIAILYLVNPLAPDRPGNCEFEASAINALSIHNTHSLAIGDCVWLIPDPDDGHPHIRVLPDPMWYLIKGDSSPKTVGGTNVVAPIMTALLILATRGVERKLVVADEKLQRARRKSGKPLIPPYEVVDASLYVTAVLARRDPALRQGGTHASPRPHLRMGHQRNLPDGRKTFVRDALVNATDEARATFRSSRSHYVVRSEK